MEFVIHIYEHELCGRHFILTPLILTTTQWAGNYYYSLLIRDKNVLRKMMRGFWVNLGIWLDLKNNGMEK